VSAALVAKEAQAKAAKAAAQQRQQQQAADAAAFAEARTLEDQRFAHEQALAFAPVRSTLAGNGLTAPGNQLTVAARPGLGGGADVRPLYWAVGSAVAVGLLVMLMKR
jgi:uncharacterized membrane protein